MAPPKPDLLFQFSNIIRVYKDGTVERLKGTEIVPASTNANTGVQSKDVVIDSKTGVSARLYIPKIRNPYHEKLPLLVYCNGGGPEAWLNHYVDFNRVFFAGDSAGANIAHNMGMRVGLKKPDGFKLFGIVLVHPYFGGKEAIDAERGNLNKNKKFDKLWLYFYPTTSGLDDPLFNPTKDPNFSKLGCSKVLVCVAGKDSFRDRGLQYKEELGKSGWGGVVEVMEAEGEGHVFHLSNPTSDNAVAMLKRLVDFVNSGPKPRSCDSINFRCSL